MIEIDGADRMRIQVDATEIDDPGELRRIPDHDLLRGAPGWKRQLDRLDPLRPRARRALLEEGLTFRAVDEALERHRPARYPAQGALGHGHVVANQVELGVARLRKEDFVGVADRDLTAGDLEDFVLCDRHGSADRLGMAALRHDAAAIGMQPDPDQRNESDQRDHDVTKDAAERVERAVQHGDHDVGSKHSAAQA